MFQCPRRAEDLFGLTKKGETPDIWRKDNTCSYCGCLLPEKALELIKAGEMVVPTDKSYKAYVGGHKLYFQHLSIEQRKEFVELYNKATMKLAEPGHFYVMPFFMSRLPAPN